MRQKTTREQAPTHAPKAAALAPTAAPDGALATSPPTTRRLAAHSLSANTRAAYTRAVRQFDAWRDGADRGRGQAAPLLADAFAAILATADQRRETGRGRESARIAARRAALDKALAAVLFQGALRRSEAAALEWRDVAPATTAGAILLTVRRSKTDQEGTAADVRYLKAAAATAVRALQPADVDPTARVFGGLTPQQLGRRFTAAAQAAGIPARLTAHSGRVGLASELTARGASTAAVMRAGAWKTARMVAHYSAGADAEHGAVARYL